MVTRQLHSHVDANSMREPSKTDGSSRRTKVAIAVGPVRQSKFAHRLRQPVHIVAAEGLLRFRIPGDGAIAS